MMTWVDRADTDTWTLPEQATIIKQLELDQSVSSSEPTKTLAGKWTYSGSRFGFGEDLDESPLEMPAFTEQQFRKRDSAKAALFREQAEKQASSLENKFQMKLRILFLKAETIIVGDSFNAASENDFWHFVASQPFMKKPKIFLTETGNLRALWQGERDEQIGLQFLGGRNIQFVFFFKRGSEMKRSYGQDTIDGIGGQITANKLNILIYV